MMEVFTLMMNRRIADTPNFKYHWRCNDQRIMHLCLSDDVLMFSHASTNSIDVFRDTLADFELRMVSFPACRKASYFFANVSPPVKNTNLTILSYAGILQLIKSALRSMQIYWCSIFMLSKCTIYEIEKVLISLEWRGS